MFFKGEETALEFPDGETPPDALNLIESSEKENEEKSKSPVRFIKSSDGTIKISSVSHTSRYVNFLVGLSVVKIVFEPLLIFFILWIIEICHNNQTEKLPLNQRDLFL